MVITELLSYLSIRMERMLLLIEFLSSFLQAKARIVSMEPHQVDNGKYPDEEETCSVASS